MIDASLFFGFRFEVARMPKVTQTDMYPHLFFASTPKCASRTFEDAVGDRI